MSNYLDKLRDDHHEFINGNFEDITGGNPFELFEIWFNEAVEKPELEPNAFVLSTVNSEHQPTSRIVYLKQIFEQQFVFFTNYNSQKGIEIAGNNRVSMLFFWPLLSRQVRIEGICTKTNEQLSDVYFNSRPKSSQIAAWASHQSEVLRDRKEIDQRVVELNERYLDVVPRPEHWGGYQIKPTQIEFWQGRPSRLHDRLVLTEENGFWTAQRKNP